MLERLLRHLNSPLKSVRERAIRNAKTLNSEELLELVALEAQHYRQWCRRMQFLFVSVIAIGIIEFFSNMFLGKLRVQDFMLIMYVILGSVQLFAWKSSPSPTNARRSLARILSERTDPSFLGSLLTYLQQNGLDKGTKQSLLDTAKLILSQMRYDQRNVLTPQQKTALVRLLQKPYQNAEWTLCVLKALEQVGDESAIPAVEYIINASPTYENGQGEYVTAFGRAHYALDSDAEANVVRIKEAAQECLAFLKTNAPLRRQSCELLRPSDSSPSVSPESLLRPAFGKVSDMAPEQLLRSTMREDLYKSRDDC